MTALPPPPAFGAPLPLVPSQERLAYLARRRSPSAVTLAAPGPDADQLRDLLTVAARAPDHGKLNPWRFIVLEGAGKALYAERLRALAAERPDAGKAAATLAKLTTPPLAVAVVSSPVEGQIPGWEQRLSAGAVCTLLLLAAEAMGFGANWITDWYSYDERAGALLGLAPREQVAGMMLIGTPAEAPQERVRPEVDALISRWTG